MAIDKEDKERMGKNRRRKMESSSRVNGKDGGSASTTTTAAGKPSTSSSATPVPTYAPRKDQVAKYVRGNELKPTNARNKKLAAHLTSLAATQKRSAAAAFEHDALLLPDPQSSRIHAETDVERTWKVSQAEIADAVGQETATKSFSLDMDQFGPYELDYSSDGRQLVIAGRKGHVATFDWRTGKLGTELHLKETVRDVCWLHNTSFFAAAQKKYVYIYDHNGIEIHQLRNHIEVTRMQFLRHHFLLATVGNPGFLKYQDTSTGAVVAEHRTKLGACSTMAQNRHSGVISLGHANGTVTMWTPNLSTPQVTMLAHGGPVSAIAVDPSSAGTYFATAGLDGTMKVWDVRRWEVVNEWRLRRPASSLTYSDRGMLCAGWGNHVTMYADTTRSAPRAPGPYMTQLFPSTSVHAAQFCPFEDVLGVGHASGFTSLLVPGAGEANYDSLEHNPYEGKKSRREREVVSLLDKLQPDQITMDPDLIGKLAARNVAKDATADLLGTSAKPGGQQQPPALSFSKMRREDRLAVSGGIEEDVDDNDEAEQQEGQAAPGSTDVSRGKPRKVRGKNKVLKRILRQKKSIIDAKTMRVREILDERRRERKAQVEGKTRSPSGALSRFG